jgi:hypothetical protein
MPRSRSGYAFPNLGRLSTANNIVHFVHPYHESLERELILPRTTTPIMPVIPITPPTLEKILVRLR